MSGKNVSAWISPCRGKVPKAWRQHISFSVWMHLRQILWIDFRVKLKLPEVTHSLGFILTKTTQTVPLLTVGTLVPFAHPGRGTRSMLLSELSVFHACCQVDAQLGAPSLSLLCFRSSPAAKTVEVLYLPAVISKLASLCLGRLLRRQYTLSVATICRLSSIVGFAFLCWYKQTRAPSEAS